MIETAQRPTETFEEFLDRLDVMILDEPLMPAGRADAQAVLYAPRLEVPTAEQIHMQSMCRGPLVQDPFPSRSPSPARGLAKELTCR